ncbi:MAG: TetR/AcrR family transcriptional regulator [Parvularculaceae bacterium]
MADARKSLKNKAEGAPPSASAKSPYRKISSQAGAKTGKSRGPKFRRRAEARPDEILDAALSVFSDKGFEAARVDDIALRAGVSKGAVYLYFNSKEALLEGLVEREVAPIAAMLSALAETGRSDPEATLRLIVATASRIIGERRVFQTPRIVLSVAGQFPEIGKYYRERVVDVAITALKGLHRAGVERGVFRDIDSDAVARAIMGPILLYGMKTHVLGAAPDEDAETRALAAADILFKGIAA